VAGALEAIAQQADEILEGAGDAVTHAAEELPAFARLLRREPRLRLALTDITLDPTAKRELLSTLLADRVAPVTLEVASVLADRLLSPEELERAADDMAVRGMLAGAEASGTLEDVEDELFRFARIVDGNGPLFAALTNPVLPDEVRDGLVVDLLRGRARPETVELVRFALETRGLRDPGEVLNELAETAASRRGLVMVEARAAVPIDVQRQARLTEVLSSVVGRPVKLEIVVDPAVGGGVVARVGDEVIDGSVRRKLELALEELTG
jgi:F-type H+-transporting ATPase subunit delta